MNTIGFHISKGSETSETSPNLSVERRVISPENYLGKPVRLRTGTGARYGIFRGIGGDWMILRPAVVVEATGIADETEEFNARLEEETPSRILTYSVAEIDVMSEDFIERYINGINSPYVEPKKKWFGNRKD